MMFFSAGLGCGHRLYGAGAGVRAGADAPVPCLVLPEGRHDPSKPRLDIRGAAVLRAVLLPLLHHLGGHAVQGAQGVGKGGGGLVRVSVWCKLSSVKGLLVVNAW